MDQKEPLRENLLDLLRVGPDVVSWNPLDDDLVPAAPSFRAWMEAWLTGALTV